MLIEHRATIKDVARAAKVSSATVSRALNQTTFVSPEVLERIEDAVKRLNYAPNSAAKQLASGKRMTLGFAVPHMRGDFFLPLLEGVEQGAHRAGYGLLIHTLPHTNKPTSLLTSPVNEHSTDGIIVFPGSLNPSELSRLAALQFPLVSLYQTALGYEQAPFINFENRASAYNLVKHLITEHGYQHIAYLRGPELQKDSLEREAGYESALIEAGLAPIVGYGDYNERRAYETVFAWFSAKNSIDAIFTGSDEAAVGTLQALRQLELRVPEDVAVVGFDDLRLAQHLAPPLTTVRVPITEGGYAAVRALLGLIRGEVVSNTVLATELVIRASCGCK